MKHQILNFVKRFLLVFVTIIAASSTYAGEIRYTLTLNPMEVTADTIIAEDGKHYLYLRAPEVGYTGEIGEPRIPYRQLHFLVPPYSNDFSVRLENPRTGEPYKCNLPILINRPESEDTETRIINNSVFSDSLTHNNAESRVLTDYYVNGNQHVVSVVIPMILTGENIRNLLSADVILSYSECNEKAMTSVPISAPPSELDIDLSDIVVNWTNQAKASISMTTYQEKKDYCYILVPESLRTAINDLVAWKRQKGLTVIVKTVEEIAPNSDPPLIFSDNLADMDFDKASSIRHWLIKEYSKIGAFQLLIIGNDFTSAPVRKFTMSSPGLGRPLEGSFNKPYYIYSDLYFSDINTKFKYQQIQGNSQIIAYRPDAFNPTLPAYRLLVRDKEEIDTYFKKLLIYQMDPGLGDASYLNSGLLCQVSDSYNSMLENNLYGKSVIEKLSSLTNQFILRDSVPARIYELSEPTGKDVIDVMRNCGLISLQGHAGPYSIEVSGDHKYKYSECRYLQPLSSSPMKEWGFSNLERGNAYDNLNNFGKPSVIYSIGCSTSPYGRIEHEDGYKDVYYNINTAYLFAGDFGGVAFVGTSVDCMRVTNLIEEDKFGSQLRNHRNIARSIINTKLQPTESTANQTQVARNLIGDPDIDVWTQGAPNEQDINISTDFSNAYFTGEGLSGSDITFYDGMEYSRSFSVNRISSPFLIDKNACSLINGKDFIVSVFNHDKLPLIKLFASGSNLKNVSKKYFFREDIITDCLGQGNYAFNVNLNGHIEINATRRIETSKGFHITSGGEVVLNSLGSMKLIEDCVDEGGNLRIEAASVTLDAGFEVKKGGTLTISAKNN